MHPKDATCPVFARLTKVLEYHDTHHLCVNANSAPNTMKIVICDLPFINPENCTEEVKSTSFFSSVMVDSTRSPLTLVSRTRNGNSILLRDPTRKKLSSVRGRQIHLPL